jgi:hypothetical protein
LINGQLVGIKETKELLIAGNEIGVFVVKHLKDGVQLEDFEAFYTKFITDVEFKNKLIDRLRRMREQKEKNGNAMSD